MMKKILLVLVLIMSFSTSAALAGDGSHNYSALKIQPRYGNTTVSHDGSIHYVSHRLYWDKSSQNFEAYYNSNAYGGNYPSSLEIDIHFYGYDKKKVYGCAGCADIPYVFGKGPRSESQSSKGTYWNSDMPYAFIDTTAADYASEPGAGIGSGYWYLADYNTWYSAWTDLTGTTTHKDDYKVLVARGHHHNYVSTPQGSCSGKYTNPWCYYTDGPATEAIENWKGNAPESGRTWNSPTFSKATISPTNSGYYSH